MLSQSPAPTLFTSNQYGSKDMELYTAWKESGDKKALGELVRQLSPIIYSEVRRASGTLPEAALSAEAKKWAVKAIQNYDPSKGTTLSTHIMNYLPKIRRLNYKFQNSARLPENLHLQYTTFQNAVSHLTEKLNRDPTDEEVASHLSWTKAGVVKFKGSLYEDLVESGSQRPIETTQFSPNKMLMDHLMNQLDETEKYVLLNVKEKSATEICQHLGVNTSRLNYIKAKLKTKIAGIKEEIGLY